MEKKNSLLAGWEHIRRRPLMYFSNDVPAVVNFLAGLRTACLLLNPAFDYETIYNQIIQERGWKNASQGIWRQMQERGMNDSEMIAELLAIHEEIWTHLDPEVLNTKVNTEA